jgi:hypothetical protein
VNIKFPSLSNTVFISSFSFLFIMNLFYANSDNGG